MERKLKTLFDYQKYEREPGLESVINGVHKRYGNDLYGPSRLDDDALGQVFAAGDYHSGDAKKDLENAGQQVLGNPLDEKR